MKTDVREELQRLANDNGGLLTASVVVKAARNKESPLHSHFEWDNKKAGERYRLVQARALINRVRVVTVHEEAKITTVKYVRAPDIPASQQGYRELLAMDEDDQRAVIVAEFSRARSCLERARKIQASCEVSEDLGQIIKSIRDVERRFDASMSEPTP